MLVLLVSLLLFIVLSTFFDRSLVLALLFTLILLSAVSAASGSRNGMIGALSLGLPFLASIWISLGTASPVAGWATIILGALLLSYTTGIVLRHVMWARDVDAEVLFGAAAVYLLIGLTFAMLCLLVELAAPGSFTNLTFLADGKPDIDAMIYYSFVTLATLGYGDITPTWDVPRTLAVIEAVLGVFYTTILVGRLVSVYTARAMIKYQDDLIEAEDAPDTHSPDVPRGEEA